MCRRFFTLVLVLISTVGMRPEGRTNDEYSRIDAYARTTPDSYARSINTLSDYLTAPARTDMDKVRVIYAWMVSHIQYDLAAANSAYRQKYYSEKEYATRVLQKRKGLCTGYALLFKYLLKRAGVDAASIRGYARTDDKESGLPVAVVDHEWNAVRIDSEWYLLDLAWAVSTAEEGQSSNDFYFLTPPDQFVSQHFPTDPRWQLLAQPVSKPEFDRFPKLYAPYFAMGYSPDFPKNGQLAINRQSQLMFRNANAMDYVCTISRFGQTKGIDLPISVTRTEDLHLIRLNVSAQGRGTLRVFAAPVTQSRSKHYECIASFTVNSL